MYLTFELETAIYNFIPTVNPEYIAYKNVKYSAVLDSNTVNHEPVTPTERP